MKIIDISQEVLSCNIYSGDPSPRAERLKSMDQGEMYNLSAFSMCAHNGTHIDAPLHFIKDGKSISEISCDSTVGYCYVAAHSGNVTTNDAAFMLEKAKNMGAGERILIAGDITVTDKAAEVFAKAGLKLLGNEGQTVGPKDAPMKVHKLLLGAGIVLLEGIVLKNIPEGRYFLSAMPLNLKGFEGSPCRAYLIEEQYVPYSKGVEICWKEEKIKIAVKHCDIGKYFKNILSCAEIGKGKEYPDIYIKAQECFGTKTAETCVFEDSHIAIDTADKLGMKTVGIYDKYNYGQEEMKKIATLYIAEGKTLVKLRKQGDGSIVLVQNLLVSSL